MELLICEDYYFYNNGVYKTIEKLSPEGWFTDLKKVEPSIRIFGTREQVDEALDTYIELTGLNLDESFEYKTEEKGSYWEDIVFSETRKDRPTLKEYNKAVNKNLAIYREKYNKLNNNKALITTI
ncbi:MAG: hypothetical protein CMB58_000455 [Methanobacteriota archaeon]|nr:MAG: hypothetical protein CMB58_000455 [Euryarchaeota archaeon]|tara:strand:+ start:27560 stop:27934 length:375 start_codon:yes stop_codon:yes gene_type:complete